MLRTICRLFLTATLFAACPFAKAQQSAGPSKPPTVSPAIDGILAAFQSHALVGIGDKHSLTQQLDFYGALVRDPRFAQQVGNVVVEFGGAAHQDIIDRYVAGDPVPYTELRKVWTDVVGWVPTVQGLGYINFYAQVRAANLALAPDKRIRVWLGEPQIDWSKIKTRGDWQRVAGFRDVHAAQIIVQDILEKHRKALVIYGTGHFGAPIESMEQMQRRKAAMDKKLGFDTPLQFGVQTLVEQKFPNAFFVVIPYDGFLDPACAKTFEKNKQSWPVPALASPVRGSSLEAELQVPGCRVVPLPTGAPPPDLTAAEWQRMSDKNDRLDKGLTADALLYLGPAERLTRTPINPQLYLDQDYRDEVSRHNQILTGQPLGQAAPQNMLVAPRPWR
ncbi:MAG TPA: hypothetical protein VJ750_05465 [Rhizomicrobium sp.]|nr:hypothetical protein [Rhizomicrobium sp.]